MQVELDTSITILPLALLFSRNGGILKVLLTNVYRAVMAQIGRIHKKLYVSSAF